MNIHKRARTHQGIRGLVIGNRPKLRYRLISFARCTKLDLCNFTLTFHRSLVPISFLQASGIFSEFAQIAAKCLQLSVVYFLCGLCGGDTITQNKNNHWTRVGVLDEFFQQSDKPKDE